MLRFSKMNDEISTSAAEDKVSTSEVQIEDESTIDSTLEHFSQEILLLRQDFQNFKANASDQDAVTSKKIKSPFSETIDKTTVFTGDDETKTVKSWIKMIEESALVYQWTPKETFLAARRALQGSAASWFVTQEGIDTWDELRAQLVSAFGRVVTSADAHAQLSDRFKLLDESVRDYVREMERIGGEAGITWQNIKRYIIEGVIIDDSDQIRLALKNLQNRESFVSFLEKYVTKNELQLYKSRSEKADRRTLLNVKVAGMNLVALLDTGSYINTIREDLFKKIKKWQPNLKLKLDNHPREIINSRVCKPLGSVLLVTRIQGRNYKLNYCVIPEKDDNVDMRIGDPLRDQAMLIFDQNSAIVKTFPTLFEQLVSVAEIVCKVMFCFIVFAVLVPIFILSVVLIRDIFF